MKRIQTSSVKWNKLADRLTNEHAAELTKLKGLNTTYQSQVSQLPADLPKIDWVAMKKKLGPLHESVVDSLQKQYEAINIPYENVPDKFNKEIDDWVQFNEARSKFQLQKITDKSAIMQKVEDKWAKAPPIEYMDQEQLVKFFEKRFPETFTDLRTNHHYIIDPLDYGYNYKQEWKDEILWRTKNYRDRKRLHKPREEMEIHD